MKNEGLPIVREGWPFLALSVLASAAFGLAGLWQIFVLGTLLTVFIAYFFRNPERLPPVGSTIVASPADGKVIFVGPARETEFTHQEMLKVSIFMSIFDVHVNRVPVDGTVRNMKHTRGRFMAAFEEAASEENERNALLIETGHGQTLVLVQVAGLIARRIICYAGIGNFVLKGQRLGLIRFGSRCDMYFPKSTEILIKVGDKTIGGETTLARLIETEG